MLQAAFTPQRSFTDVQGTHRILYPFLLVPLVVCLVNNAVIVLKYFRINSPQFIYLLTTNYLRVALDMEGTDYYVCVCFKVFQFKP